MQFERNTDLNYYNEHVCSANCGGFALRINEWYITDRDFDNTEEVEYMLDEGYDIDEVFDILTFRNVEQIMHDFEGEIRILLNADAPIKEDEELISFRLGIIFIDYVDTDFHFRVKRDGYWQEKPGSQEVRFCEFSEDNWPTSGDITYNGPIVYMAKKIVA